MRRPVTRRHRAFTLMASLALATGLTACGTEGAGPGDATTAPTASPTSPTEDDTSVTSDKPTRIPSPEPTDGPGNEALPSGPVDASVREREDVRAALQLEAERTGAAVEEIEVVGFADVTWNDGAIGCPREGMMYTQALVPGHQLILEVDGEKASYHSGRDGVFFHCANPIAPIEGYSGGGGSISDM